MPRSPAGRQWVLNAHDGVMTTTGLVQGFAGAGATGDAAVFAAVALMVSGGLALGANSFIEFAQERAAEMQLVEEEAESIERSPQEHRDDLRDHYVERGLTPELAEDVAAALFAADPVGAELETEHGLPDGPMGAWVPWLAAARSFAGYVSGALPVAAVIVFVHGPWRALTLVAVTTVVLVIIGLLSSWSGSGSTLRAVARSVVTGLIVSLLSYAAGVVFEWLDALIPVIDLDIEGG